MSSPAHGLCIELCTEINLFFQKLLFPVAGKETKASGEASQGTLPVLPWEAVTESLDCGMCSDAEELALAACVAVFTSLKPPSEVAEDSRADVRSYSLQPLFFLPGVRLLHKMLSPVKGVGWLPGCLDYSSDLLVSGEDSISWRLRTLLT